MIGTRRFQGVDIDQRIIVQDGGMISGDKTHATHVCCQGIDLIDTFGGSQAVLPTPQVEQEEFIGIDMGKLRIVQIRASDPVSQVFEMGRQVVANETAGSSDKDLAALCHREALLWRVDISPAYGYPESTTGYGHRALP
jgi:hypothetical protein